MLVKDLIAKLQELDQNMVIEIADGYWRSEGYDDDDMENASSGIGVIREHNGKYIIEDESF